MHMNWQDITNGAFEATGGGGVWLHARAIWRDRTVAGFSPWACCIFTAWGLWNLYYYPSLGQWASFAGGLCIVAGNLVWVAGLAAVYCGWIAPRPRGCRVPTRPASMCANPNCGSTEDVRMESARTAYHYEGDTGSPEDPNKPLPLCRKCAAEHHQHWDGMWAEYQQSLM